MNNHPSDQDPARESAVGSAPAAVAERQWLPGGCWTWVVTGMVLAVFATISLPCFGCVQVRGSQTKALAQAKQIGLALKLFADDHDGNYPRQGVPVENKDAPANSNVAFAALFPTYTQSESIFGNKLCHGAVTPDNRIDSAYDGKPHWTLSPGENVYGYVMGLTDKSDPLAPVIVDGTDGTGHYTRNARKRGGVWKGEKAVVVRLDNSAALETLTGPDDARFIVRRMDPATELSTRPGDTRHTPRPAESLKNLLDVDYLGKGVRYLDPVMTEP